MKKVIIGLTLCVFAFVSCTNEDALDIQTTSKATTSNIRSLTEAIQIAENSIKFLGEPTDSRSIGRVVDLENVKYVLNSSSRSAGSNDTLLYVINYADEQGFAVISANMETEGLLAVIEKGNYDATTEHLDENGGFAMFMDMAEQYVATASLGNTPPIDTEMEIKEVYDTLSVNRIGPKVAVQWGQTGCEGTYAPNGISGCSNTAMAQIMSYFAYPSTLNITYDGASISSLALNWNQIKMHKDKYIHTNCGTAHESIAQLMRQLGEMNYSDYSDPNGTGTYASNVRNSFATLGYTVSDLIDYNQEDFTTQLNNNKLIYMRGVCADGCGGHAWVVDGSLHCTLHVTEWAKYADEGEWVYWEDAGTRSLQYIHINWGWDGSCNGHFSINVFNTQSGVYDNPSQMYGNTANHHFNGGLRYFEVTH